MKRYDEKMLGKLLDRYEGSVLYSGQNQVNISITVSIQKRTFPEYFDELSLQYDVIHEQLEQLEAAGYVRLIWKNNKRGHILDKCELVVERVDEIYRLLRRQPRDEKEQSIRRICESYRGKTKALEGFCGWIEKRLDEDKSIKKYVDVDKPEDFSRLCELILKIQTNTEECFLRQFSSRHFHDSKAAEKEIEKAAGVIAEFSDDFDGLGLSSLGWGEILEEYNIYRNPSWLMMKGYGSFYIESEDKRTRINLQALYGGIGLSNQDIGNICWELEKGPKRIVTIENLSSFHQWNGDAAGRDGTLCIYLGGYHNQVKRQFLKQIYEIWPDVKYCHFGDIDCGGFGIWKDLCQKTGIAFDVLGMDEQTYLGHLQFGKELTEFDRKRLEAMKLDVFFSKQVRLFELMMEKGIKIEQECVGVPL